MDGYDDIKFACDAMLGALARWLRVAGYDCFWQEGIDDAVLVELALKENRILLTADSGIFKRGVVYRREVKALYIQRDLPRDQQAAHVLHTFCLPRRSPRCMPCGGVLLQLDREIAQSLVPAGAFKENSDFFRCSRCQKVYWQGTHWKNIDKRLSQLGFPLSRDLLPNDKNI